MFRVRPWAGSGPHRATGFQQHAQRAGSGQSLAHCRKAHPFCGYAACEVRLRRLGTCGGCGLPHNCIPVGACPLMCRRTLGQTPTDVRDLSNALRRLFCPFYRRNAPLILRYSAKTTGSRHPIIQTRQKNAVFATATQPSGHTFPVAAFGRNREAGLNGAFAVIRCGLPPVAGFRDREAG
jgi:hypothetical protein